MLECVTKDHKSSVNVIHHMLNVSSWGDFVNFRHFLGMPFIWAWWFWVFLLCPILRLQNTAVKCCLCFLELTVSIFRRLACNSPVALWSYKCVICYCGFQARLCCMYSDGGEWKDNKGRIKTVLGGMRGFLTDFVGVLKELIQLAVEKTTFQKDTNSS